LLTAVAGPQKLSEEDRAENATIDAGANETGRIYKVIPFVLVRQQPPFEDCRSADPMRISVASNEKNVSVHEFQSLAFCLRDCDLLEVVKVDAAADDVRNSQYGRSL
jgi:hypothetical protein